MNQTKLDARLEALLRQEWFDPPQAFVEAALITDMSAHEVAERDPVAWWGEQASALDWERPWRRLLDDDDAPSYRWFTGGRLNASHNCLDRHVAAGNGARVALYWHGEEGETRALTYADLLAEVMRCANALRDRGVAAGDVVGIYLPMIPEVVVAMLACARIGAMHNVVFGGFGPEAMAERMGASAARALIIADGARRKGQTTGVKANADRLIDDLPGLETVLVVKHTGDACEMRPGRDSWWHEALASADPDCLAEPFDSEHPLFLLYSSGSTAKPKGIVHTTGGYLTGVAWSFKYVFDLNPQHDVYWCSADVGWITGHSYIVYGPLLNGATSVMFEGAPDYPHKGIWWEICERYGVTTFYTAPTAIRTCMKWGAEHLEAYDLSALRLLGSVGEPINPRAWVWYWEVVGGGRCPVVDTWWQTETGQIVITTLPGAQRMKPGCAGTPLPGMRASVLAEDGAEAEAGTQGLLTLDRPWPAMLRTLFGEPERYLSSYWERFGADRYAVGDAARRDRDGYVWIVGRVDDVINASGHRLSTAEIESAIVGHPAVAEAAVVGVRDPDTGESICAFVTLAGDRDGDADLVLELRQRVTQRIGKLARPKRVIWAPDLPKTRSGKIIRRLLQDIAEGRELGDVTTLRDPEVVQRLRHSAGATTDEGASKPPIRREAS